MRHEPFLLNSDLEPCRTFFSGNFSGAGANTQAESSIFELIQTKSIKPHVGGLNNEEQKFSAIQPSNRIGGTF